MRVKTNDGFSKKKLFKKKKIRRQKIIRGKMTLLANSVTIILGKKQGEG